MADVTAKLVECLRQLVSAHELGVLMARSGLEPAREALRLYDAAKAQPELRIDGLTPQEFALRELYEFQEATGCDTAAEYLKTYPERLAAPVAQPEPRPEGEWPKCPSPYQGDQYIGYSRTDLLKYAREVLAAHNIKEQP